MDLLKELAELKESVRKALEDNRISPLEALMVAKELIDVLQILLPLFIGLAPKVGEKSQKTD